MTHETPAKKIDDTHPGAGDPEPEHPADVAVVAERAIEELLTKLVAAAQWAAYHDDNGHVPELAEALRDCVKIRRRILQRVGDLQLLASQWHRLAMRAAKRD